MGENTSFDIRHFAVRHSAVKIFEGWLGETLTIRKLDDRIKVPLRGTHKNNFQVNDTQRPDVPFT